MNTFNTATAQNIQGQPATWQATGMPVQMPVAIICGPTSQNRIRGVQS